MNPARAPVAAAFGFPIGPSGIQSAPRPLSAACHILLRPGGVGIETLERAKGIEPSYAAWEAAVLPLNYARRRREHTRTIGPAARSRCRTGPIKTLDIPELFPRLALAARGRRSGTGETVPAIFTAPPTRRPNGSPADRIQSAENLNRIEEFNLTGA